MNDDTEIVGYRELTQGEVDAINAVKAMGEAIERVVLSVEQLQETDPRWVNIARTDLQKGLMSLVRSIARPESF